MNPAHPTLVSRYADEGWSDVEDVVAAEAPLQIRVGGARIAVVMRTPGADEVLAAGFLFTERMIHRADDIVRVAHCESVPEGGEPDNVIDVTLAEDCPFDPDVHRRALFASSSCGVCGKASIEAVMHTAGPLQSTVRAPLSRLIPLVDELRAQQVTFAATGGLHAAGLYDLQRDAFSALYEDVGRHNAVDKCVGARLAHDEERARSALVVSGRVSFEIVQKAVAASVPLIVAVSAPTSLAVDAARTLGVTLVGFVRGGRANVYSAVERVR